MIPPAGGRRASDHDRLVTRKQLVVRTIFGLLSCAFGAILIWRMVEVDHKHASLFIWLGVALLAYGGYHVSQRVTEDFMEGVRAAVTFWRQP